MRVLQYLYAAAHMLRTRMYLHTHTNQQFTLFFSLLRFRLQEKYNNDFIGVVRLSKQLEKIEYGW